MYRWVIDDHLKLLLTYDGRQGKIKYPPTDFRPQLYDLIADPHEKENLAAERPDEVARLVKKLEAWYPVKERKTVTTWSDEPVVLEPVKD